MIQPLQPPRAVVLSGVSWATYQSLRRAPENRNIRMTFDHGVLEVVSPSKLHENVGRLIGDFILFWTQDRKIPRHSCGALTMQLPAEELGGEPDGCYFLHDVAAVEQRDEFDLEVDGPPDLVVEVDVTSMSERRMGLYGSIGVEEVWRWRNEELIVLRRNPDGQYERSDVSQTLPDFPVDKASELLRRRRRVNENQLMDEFLAFIRQPS